MTKLAFPSNFNLFDPLTGVLFEEGNTGFNEMAAPGSSEREQVYYHATSSEKAAQTITRDGVVAPQAAKSPRSLTAPVPGRVYLTPDISYALIYALGCNMAGHDIPEFVKKYGRYGYVFEIPGEGLSDIQPDEDNVGKWVNKAMEMERDGTLERSSIEQSLLQLAQKHLSDRVFSKVRDGEYAYFAAAGKKLMRWLSDDMKLVLIRAGKHIANQGPIKPTTIWQVDKTRSKEFKKDGSNFFHIAKKVKKI